MANFLFHTYENDADYIAGVTAEIVAGLTHRPSAATKSTRAQLFLSGGTSPAPVYASLATQNLDWSQIDIRLVDERWVKNTAERKSASNASMIARTLLTENTVKATFHRLADYASDMPTSIAQANAGYQTPTVVVLGMGEDGHTASLFPNASALQAAFDCNDAYTSLDATGCPVAGKWPERITMTPHGWAHAANRLLLIRGQAKKEVFEAAIAAGDMLKYPVLAALTMGQALLNVHWAA